LIAARYFSSNSSDSGSLRTPCHPPACAAGRQGITPAFGYSAPHPSAGGTLTLLTHALLSTHYGGVRLPASVHHRLRLVAFPMRTRSAHGRWSDVGYPSFRRDPFARDVALDPGGTTVPRLTALPMLRSTMKTVSAPAIRSFRGSLPHPTQPLCTLRVRRRRRLTQHSLPGCLLGITWTGLAPADRASFCWRLPSLDHLVGTQQDRLRHDKAEGLGGPEV
jgi:hypothetical protein